MLSTGIAGCNERRTITFSAILLRCGVTEIGQKSEKPIGADTLGTGVTNALSHITPITTNFACRERTNKYVCNDISKLMRAAT